MYLYVLSGANWHLITHWGIQPCPHLLPTYIFVTCHPPFAPPYQTQPDEKQHTGDPSCCTSCTDDNIRFSNPTKTLIAYKSTKIIYCRQSDNKTAIQGKYSLKKNRHNCCYKYVFFQVFAPARCREPLTFCGFVLDGLLEQGDVLKRAEEQNHLVVLVPDGSHLHVEPHRASCRDATQTQKYFICIMIHYGTVMSL